jgi:hypothetical protein
VCESGGALSYRKQNTGRREWGKPFSRLSCVFICLID